MGQTLSHEHVLVDFIGADEVGPERYDRDEVFDTALPHLKQARALGCRTLIECTPAYLARDPLLLKRLSEASGLHILTNTGYYGARQDQFLPAHALAESDEALARRWVREWEEGIDGTGIRPGFIKIGVDGGTLSSMHRKLIRAAARTHLHTGLTIAAHTGDGVAALDQMDELEQAGCSVSAWVWVHAQGESDPAIHMRAAERGAWVSFDGVGPERIEQHLSLLANMKRHGLLHRVLISHDAGWYHVGEPGGGRFRPYDTLFTRFLPALKRSGFTDREIRRLLVSNPAEAFAIRVRRR